MYYICIHAYITVRNVVCTPANLVQFSVPKSATTKHTRRQPISDATRNTMSLNGAVRFVTLRFMKRWKNVPVARRITIICQRARTSRRRTLIIFFFFLSVCSFLLQFLLTIGLRPRGKILSTFRAKNKKNLTCVVVRLGEPSSSADLPNRFGQTQTNNKTLTAVLPPPRT